MLFDSLDFAIFLPMVFLLYWALGRVGLRLQNAGVVIASYFFYGWWDWRFLSLILFSTVVDYWVGIQLAEEERLGRRKALLWMSILVNLGFLGVFKYFNFFVANIETAFSFFGQAIDLRALSIVLPVGISFYTFQTLSYSIDVYRRRLEPTRDFIAFAAFVSFFPQLVAGPIERATHLLPQLCKKRKFDYERAVEGGRQILWGLFKKVVVADNCAVFANLMFNNWQDYSGSALWLGAIFFAFQIYGDFSGYSDIAIGTAKLFGVELKQNFAFPYFSRDIAEFWRRWHISLSTWFRDYLYIPLGGSKGSTAKRVRNTFAIFVVSGFWHGANWTFIVWGCLNAIFFLPLLLLQRNRVHLHVVAQGRWWPNLRECAQMLTTFLLVVVAWVFFRADNLSHALGYVAEMFSASAASVPVFEGRRSAMQTLIWIFACLGVEWIGREESYGLAFLRRWHSPTLRMAACYGVILTILLFGNFEENPFIYFQF